MAKLNKYRVNNLELALEVKNRILVSEIFGGILEGDVTVESSKTRKEYRDINGCEIVAVPLNAGLWFSNYERESSQGLRFNETPIIDRMILETLTSYTKRKGIKALIEPGKSDIGDEVLIHRYYIFYLK